MALPIRSKIVTVLILIVICRVAAVAEDFFPYRNSEPMAVNVDSRVFSYGVFVDFHILFGIGYVVNISNDMSRMEQLFALHTPIGLLVDTRIFAWLSIYSGLEFLYEINSMKQTLNDDSIVRHFYHNLQIEIPITAKFYPFVDKGSQYENMFFSAGLTAHFNIARFYGVNTGDGIVYGNVYVNNNENIIPAAAFPPANVGLRLSMGNTFFVKEKAGVGLELYLSYMFIPAVCGYWTDPNYIIKDNPYLDFNLTVGVAFTIAIRGYSSLRE